MRGEILSGKTTRERKLAVCSGGASLEPAVRVELLAVLSADADQLIAQRAAEALLSQSLEAFLSALVRPDVAPALLRYCAQNLVEKPGVADALAKNATCPPELLLRVVPRLTTAAVQALIEDLERLSSTPALAAALLAAPAASPDQRSQLGELLGEDAYDEAALAEAVALVLPPGDQRQTLLQRLAKMRVLERVQLALRGDREERMALIRDPSKSVQRSVLQSPKITETEVEAFAAMAILSDEVLRVIASNRAFIKNYIVARNLVNNPKTPLDISLHLLPRLNPQDLKILALNRNVPETLRSTAAKLQRQRKESR